VRHVGGGTVDAGAFRVGEGAGAGVDGRVIARPSVTHRRSQIIGLENHATRNHDETHELVLEHMRALRRLECYAAAEIVFIPEDNLGNEAQSVSEIVMREIVNVRILMRTPTRYGVRTEHKTRRGPYVSRVNDLFANSAIRYHDGLVSANPFISNRTPADKATATRVEFEAQLARFQNVHVLATSIVAEAQVVSTGKADHQKKTSTRMKDDMVLALLIGIYHSAEFIRGNVDSRTYGDALHRINAPPVAPIVRHEHVGGREAREFAERERVARPPATALPDTSVMRALKRKRM